MSVIKVTEKFKTLKFEDGVTSPRDFPFVEEPFGDSLHRIQYSKLSRGVSAAEIDCDTPPEVVTKTKKFQHD